jgi:hypothetical protein
MNGYDFIKEVEFEEENNYRKLKEAKIELKILPAVYICYCSQTIKCLLCTQSMVDEFV